ncbi:MAG: DUF5667 domain-containing protein [Anaerolineales bacterium]|jgi:hypothetical protein
MDPVMNAKSGPEPEIDRDLEEMLRGMKRTAPRDPQKAARAREAFLAEARNMSPRVSNLPSSRLNRWQDRFGAFGLLTRREKKPVFNLVMTVLLVLGAVFGGGATAVAASQNAQPDSALYFVKTLSEDVRMDVEADPQARLDLALQYTTRRMAETRAMLAAQSQVPESLMLRLQNQLQQALMLAAGMPNGEALQALAQVREQARLQDQTMEQLQLQTASALQTRTRVRTMLQTQEQLAQVGIQDPTWLRQQLQRHTRSQIIQTLSVTEPAVAPVAPAGGGNPWVDGTPTPGSSYGPGTSQNPWTDETPVPGSGYGPGPGTGEPLQDGSGSGSEVGNGSQGGGGASQGAGGNGNGGSKGP